MDICAMWTPSNDNDDNSNDNIYKERKQILQINKKIYTQ